MYKEKLTKILDQLNDIKTLCGIELLLNKNKDGRRADMLFPIKENTYYNTFFKNDSEYIVLLDKGMVKYGPEVDSLISDFTHYLTNANTALYNTIFSEIDYIIKEQKSKNMYSAAFYTSEFKQFESEIEILQKAGRLSKKFNCQAKYNECVFLRLHKRNAILELIEFKIEGIREDIAGSVEQLSDIVLTTAAEKVAWLYELGIVKIILDRCKLNDKAQPNWNNAAKIIASFTGIKDTAIKTYLPEIGTGKKNDPLKNKKTMHNIAGFKQNFKL